MAAEEVDKTQPTVDEVVGALQGQLAQAQMNATLASIRINKLNEELDKERKKNARLEKKIERLEGKSG